MRSEAQHWRPNASLETLKARAELNSSVRFFFVARGVLEVETPILSTHATVDRQIESFQTRDGGWLQTSPEFAMKRLLAAGSGPIFQIARVFRLEEQGRHHNPEFTLLEWYRPGFTLEQLMDEMEALMRQLVGISDGAAFERLSYREAYLLHGGFDPFTVGDEELRTRAIDAGLIGSADFPNEERDFWLDLWMSLRIGPQLGRDAPAFLHSFPTSQAALARIREGDPPVAARFELIWRGLELANGFHELCDAREQHARFLADQDWRNTQGRNLPPYDVNLIEALAHGLPDSSGVALGLDRVLMLKLGLDDIAQTLAFSRERA